jgi:hypothetical protein
MLMRPRAAALCLLALISAMASRSHAKAKLDTQGYVETDVRFALPGKAFERNAGELRFNENRFALQLDAELNPKVAARAAVRTVFVGCSFVATCGAQDPSIAPKVFDLTQRAQIDPFWWELDAAYIELRDVGIEGLDIRIGRQIVHFGTADQFNPTNNINPFDFRDPITFGQNIANNLLKIDYNPGKDVVLTAVWVPVFRTAQLPYSGLQILSDPSAFARRFPGNPLATLSAPAGTQYDIAPQTPALTLRNSMAAAKVAFKVFGSDFSFSYFRGFFSLPRPEKIAPSLVGTPKVRVELGYPAMQSLGFDFATSIPFLKGLGLWVEGAVIFHDELRTVLDLGAPGLNQSLVESPAGYFVKLAAGFDYSFHKQLYANIQYLHGFVDEFGSPQLNDYVVAGVDIKSPSERVVLRLFGVLNLQDKSHVYYPVLMMKPWGGTEIHVGALLYGGEKGTKFGGLEAGSNLFFVKARLSF